MRLVLDTNAWLDWLVFQDPEIDQIRTSRQSRVIEIVIDEPCRDELVRVLAYPKFKLDTRKQADMLVTLDRMCVDPGTLRYPSADQLPGCKDPDDIKFQALAYAARADWLITKDKALLSSRPRNKLVPIPYRVATPLHWGQMFPNGVIQSSSN